MGELEQLAFDTMARAYPHEIYTLRPDDFWELFQRDYPGVTREKMEEILAETEHDRSIRSI